MQRSLLASVVVLSIALLTTLSPAYAQDETPPAAGTALNAVQTLLEQTLEDYTSTLTVLALTTDVQSLDWGSMQVLLATWAEEALPAAVWFALPDGTYYTVTDGLMDRTLSDRAYFPRLLNGETVCGDVVVSKSTGELSAIVAVPVMVDGAVGGALGMSVEFSGWQESLGERLDWSTEEILAVSDADGKVLLRVLPAGAAGLAAEQLDQLLQTAIAGAPEATAGSISFADDTWALNYQTSELTSWRIFLGARE